MAQVIAAVVPVPDSGWLVQRLTEAGEPLAEPVQVTSAADLAGWESDEVRWLWDSTEPVYQPLFAAGVRLQRCHDVSLTERILLGREGRYGAPSAAAAVHARRHGLPVPPDRAVTTTGVALTLFDTVVATPAPAELTMLREAYVDQLRRTGPDNALRLLVAAESAAALAAVEMGVVGLPLRADVLDGILTEQLGPRPAPGTRPAKMAVLAMEIDAAFGSPVNVDSAVELREAFRRAGFDIESTRSWVIGQLEHPAVAPVLAYKELSRLFTANGWNWLAEWVRNGRFHAGYLPGGVVSGRWAARGGGALQLPRVVRRAVIADPGRVFVVADAAQLEPRVLAAISRDPVLQGVSQQNDLYTALADDGFGGNRAQAKVAMLGAMYGATSGEAGRLVSTLRRRYPVAMAFVEDAARQGELGGVVSSVLGRTSPGPSQDWWDQLQAGSLTDATPAQERRARQIARDRGRFTRNFVVQGSAADWAGVWLSGVRRDVRAVKGAELVFFQHDELIVHTPVEHAEQVAELTVAAAEAARTLVFPGASVAMPVKPVTVSCYGDAK
jgi:DNA polymerase-1